MYAGLHQIGTAVHYYICTYVCPHSNQIGTAVQHYMCVCVCYYKCVSMCATTYVCPVVVHSTTYMCPHSNDIILYVCPHTHARMHQAEVLCYYIYMCVLIVPLYTSIYVYISSYWCMNCIHVYIS